jgi:hypothetical protein
MHGTKIVVPHQMSYQVTQDVSSGHKSANEMLCSFCAAGIVAAQEKESLGNTLGTGPPQCTLATLDGCGALTHVFVVFNWSNAVLFELKL